MEYLLILFVSVTPISTERVADLDDCNTIGRKYTKFLKKPYYGIYNNGRYICIPVKRLNNVN